MLLTLGDYKYFGTVVFTTCESPNSAHHFKTCVVVSIVALVLWHCWLGIRKSIRPVKSGVMRCWVLVICLEWGADCLHMVQLMPLHPRTPLSLASFKSRLLLPLWYRLTQVVPEKRPLNGCSSSSVHGGKWKASVWWLSVHLFVFQWHFNSSDVSVIPQWVVLFGRAILWLIH